jgi:hypothetical protein
LTIELTPCREPNRFGPVVELTYSPPLRSVLRARARSHLSPKDTLLT